VLNLRPETKTNFKTGSVPESGRTVLQLQNLTADYLLIYLENLLKPSEMPRPLALTGTTAHTQNTLHQVTKHKKKNI